MSIGWQEKQRALVEDALARHPIESSRCAEAARMIFPEASTLEEATRAIKLVGKDDAPFILTKCRKQFCHHVSVVVVKHMVDALTGVDGFAESAYLEQYWQYHEEIDLVAADLGDTSL